MAQQQWWRRWFGAKTTSARQRLVKRFRPHVEELEGRLAPAVLTVNSLLDIPVANELSLRQAVAMANTDAAAGISDTILFDSSLAGQTLTLQQGQLELTAGSGTTTINGGGQITVSGGGLSGVFEVDSMARAVLTGLTIEHGTGIIDQNSTLGGAIDNKGTLTLSNSALSANSASDGGGIFNNGLYDPVTGMFNGASAATLTVINSTISSDNADYGGGIFNNGGTLTVNNSTISGNSATEDAGGIANGYGSTLLVSNSTISGNSCYGPDGGGGIGNSNGTNSTVSNSTISGNSAANGFGGGIGTGSAPLTISNCTLSGNTAGYGGGGIYSYGNGLWVTVSNSTISNNSVASDSTGAYGGGGILIYNPSANLSLSNTIVALNTSNSVGPDIRNSSTNVAPFTLTPTVVSLGHNLIGNTQGSAGWVASDLTGTSAHPLNPLLGPLHDYGGPTQTMALLPGSPAIDAGSNALIPTNPATGLPYTTDQRGQNRMVGDTVDIGAFESEGFTLNIASGNNQAQSTLSPFSPLVVSVTANNAVEPVDGGAVAFSVTPAANGAGDTLSSATATITNGQASVTPTANAVVGSYTVTASSRGAGTPATFLTVNVLPSNVLAAFSGEYNAVYTATITFPNGQTGETGANSVDNVNSAGMLTDMVNGTVGMGSGTLTPATDGSPSATVVGSGYIDEGLTGGGGYTTYFFTGTFSFVGGNAVVSGDVTATDGVDSEVGTWTATRTGNSQVGTTFTNLTASQTVTYGTPSVTLAGHLAANASGQQVPNGEPIDITLNGVTQSTLLDSNDNFITTFDTHTLGASGSPYTIAYLYAGDTTFQGTGDSSTALTVSPYAFSYPIASDSQTYGTPADLAHDLGTTIFTGVNGENLDIVYSSSGNTATAAAGSHAITGTVSNGTGLASNYNVTLTNGTLTVNSEGTTTTLASSVTSSLGGQVVPLIATVARASGFAGAPTGTVNFYDGGNLLGTGSVQAVSGGTYQATYLTALQSSGAHTITAVYSGDSNFAGSSGSLPQSLLVSAVSTPNLQTVLTQSTVTFQPVDNTSFQNLIAAVNGLNPQSSPVNIDVDLPSGITITDVTAAPPRGVTLVLIGDGRTTTIVGHSPALTVSSGTVIDTGIIFTTDTDSPTILVTGGSLTLRGDTIQESSQFTDAAISVAGTGTLDLGTVANPGDNLLEVIGSGEFVHNTTTQLVPASGDTFTVNGAPLAAPLLSFTALSSAVASSPFGQAVTFTAQVTPDATGPAAGSGSVDFFDTTTHTDLGTAPLSGGQAVLSTAALALGNHVVLATYSGDGNYLPGLDTVTQTILQATPAFTNLTAAQTITYGTASVRLSGHLTANAGQQFVPAGEAIQVILNGVTQSALLDSNDNFSTGFDTHALAVSGSPYTIGYVYAGDGNFQSARASNTALTVNKGSQTITWLTPAPIVYGTALSSAQLNASVAGVFGGSAPGTLSYSPGLGLVPNLGLHQALTVTAAATTNYLQAVQTVYLDVLTPSETVVTSAGDNNQPGTLRNALAQASADAVQGISDTIVFDVAQMGTQTILLTKQLEFSGVGAGTVTINGGNQVTISSNHSSRVFQIDAGARAVLTGLTIQGGKAATGAGILNNGILTISNSTLSGNAAAATDSGGGGLWNNGTLTISASTIANNSATGSYTAGPSTASSGSLWLVSGGGVWNAGTLTISNSTIANNSLIGTNSFGQSNGGGIGNIGTLTVSHSTIAGNSATFGGGIFLTPQTPQESLILLNSIVAGNFASNGITPSPSDIDGSLTRASSFNLVGTGGNLTTGNGNLVGVSNPGLSPLGNYGGPTPTVALNPTSPAVGQGGADTTLTAAIPDATTTTIKVANAAAIASTPGSYLVWIDSEQFLVTGVSGNTLTVVRGQGNTTPVAHVAGTGVFLATDQRGAPRSNPPDIGAYQIQGSGTTSLLVTSRADPATLTPGTLRYAIAQAHVNAAHGISNTISFDVGQMGSGPIVLLQGQLELLGTGTGTVTIAGGNQVTISGNNSSRVFQIDAGAQAVLTGLTIQGGKAATGAGILNNGILTISNSTIAGNAAAATDSGGGGIWNNGTLTISATTIANNSATGQFTLGPSTVNGGSAWLVSGGGVWNAGTLTISNSTIANNSLTSTNSIGHQSNGGGIGNLGILTVSHSTIADNSATYGGGIFLTPQTPQESLTLLNSIVAGNFASNGVTPSPSDIDGSLTRGSFNLVGVSNPGLSPLGNYGGPTQTVALKPTSPAIGQGGAETTLTATIPDATTTTIKVADAAAIASTPGSYLIQIDGEAMLVTNVSSNTLTVLRGYNNTPAAVHHPGASVYLATDQRGVPRPLLSDIGADQTQLGLSSLSGTQWTVNQPGYASVITVTGGTAGYNNLQVTGLPAGLRATLAGNTITLSGTPTQSGTFNSLLVSVRDSSGATLSNSYSLTINPPVSLGNLSVTEWTANQAYLGTITVSGGTVGYSNLVVTGLPPALPPGQQATLTATLSGNTITLSGTPIQSGTYTLGVSVRDSTGAPASASYSLTIDPANPLTLLPNVLATDTAGLAYSAPVFATGGSGHYTFTLSAGALPPGLTLGSDGVVSGRTTLAGTFSFTVLALDTSIADLTGSRTITLTVNPAAASSFGIIAPTTPVSAGVGFPVNITAYDPYLNIATGYTGIVHFTSTDTIAPLPANYTFTSGAGRDNGVHTFTVTLHRTGTQTVAVADTNAPGISGNSNSITVNPGPASQFIVNAPGTVTAGDAVNNPLNAFTVQLTAEDLFGNIVSNYNTQATITRSDNQTVALLGPIVWVNGIGTASIVTQKATVTPANLSGTATLTAAVGSVKGTSGAITVKPAAASQFVFGNVPSTAIAGQPFGASITAQDPYSNVVISYNNPAVTLTSSDGQVVNVTPTSFLWSKGTTIPAVTLNTANVVTLTATATGLQAATSHSITVNLAVSSATLSAATAGQLYNGPTIAVTGGSGHYSFAVFSGPAGLTVTSTTNGAGVFGGTMTRAGTFHFTVLATDTLTGRTGTQNYTLVVNPKSAVKLVFTVGPPVSIIAGQSFSIAVSAQDPYNNIDPNYTGVVTLTADNGPVSPATCQLVQGNGSANVTLSKSGATTFRATVVNLQQATSAITVNPGVPTFITVSGVPNTMTVNQTVTVTITVLNQYRIAYSGSVNIRNSNGSSVSVSSTTVQTNSNGQATFNLTAVHSGTVNGVLVNLTASAGSISQLFSTIVFPSLYLYSFTLYAYDSDGNLLYDSDGNPLEDSSTTYAQNDQQAGVYISNQAAVWGQQLDDEGYDWSTIAHGALTKTAVN